MAIAIDETVSNSKTTTGTTLSVTSTAGGSGIVGVVLVSHRYGADGVSSVTYDGVSMTRAIGSFTNTAAYIYYLANPASGSVTVTANFVADSTNRGAAISLLNLSGANTSDPINTTNSGTSASANTSSVSVTTTVDGCLLVDAMLAGVAETPTITGGQTLVYSGNGTDADTGGLGWGQSRETKATAGAESMSWSWTSSIAVDHVVAAIEPAPAVTFQPRPIAVGNPMMY